MKAKLIRCGICSSWFGASYGHCHVCGATRAVVINGRAYHFDAGNFYRWITRDNSRFLISQNQELRVARELSE